MTTFCYQRRVLDSNFRVLLYEVIYCSDITRIEKPFDKAFAMLIRKDKHFGFGQVVKHIFFACDITAPFLVPFAKVDLQSNLACHKILLLYIMLHFLTLQLLRKSLCSKYIILHYVKYFNKYFYFFK